MERATWPLPVKPVPALTDAAPDTYPATPVPWMTNRPWPPVTTGDVALASHTEALLTATMSAVVPLVVCCSTTSVPAICPGPRVTGLLVGTVPETATNGPAGSASVVGVPPTTNVWLTAAPWVLTSISPLSELLMPSEGTCSVIDGTV